MPAHEHRQVRVVVTLLHDRLAAPVEREVVPDVAAVDLDREVHLGLACVHFGRVVGRKRRGLERDVQLAEPVLVRAQERDRVLGRLHADRGEQRVHVVADQIGDRADRPVRVFPGRRVLAPGLVDRAVLDDAGGVGHPLGEEALEGIEEQRAGRLQQGPHRLAAQESPAEDVVLSLPEGQRLVGRQVVRAERELRLQEPLAQEPRLRRLDRPHADLSALEPVGARAQLGILAEGGQRRIAVGRDRRRGATVGGDRVHARGELLLEPVGVLQRLLEVASRPIAVHEAEIAGERLEPRAIDRVVAGLARGRDVLFDAGRQHRQRRRDAEHLQVVVLARAGRIAVGVQRDRWRAPGTSRGRRSAWHRAPPRPAGSSAPTRPRDRRRAAPPLSPRRPAPSSRRRPRR